MIEIKNLTKKYNEQTIAVNHLNMTIQDGDIYGFVGANGAGKSTTIKSIVGIHDFDDGEIFIEGKSILEDPVNCKKELAFVPDSPNLYDNLTGLQYINFISNIYEVPLVIRRANIEKYGNLLNMTSKLNDLISSYSHGMKQRITLIAALVHEPKIFILDEPFVGLDPTATIQLRKIMSEHAKKGGIVFFSSHVLEVIEKLCNKVAIIHHGELIKHGKTKDVLGDKNLEDIFMEVQND
ncbi:ABC-2 type transport system ATP-binding protein [Natranaerovirga hydrolytica]|uniref:ABC-2 type transport system ATP-binding protein n=1 Tax=Natranaerovirga hydrolytica TaxID=680378 RepID=A0A4R1MZZ2_9FIRM|nr:ABC transporter ATP-binding protein [Natranaerovirga hydrolytica]TCK98775.1 ABC-2 type transport system ATP-binding protein [Natranaerovirga hydrolytica]